MGRKGAGRKPWQKDLVRGLKALEANGWRAAASENNPWCLRFRSRQHALHGDRREAPELRQSGFAVSSCSERHSISHSVASAMHAARRNATVWRRVSTVCWERFKMRTAQQLPSCKRRARHHFELFMLHGVTSAADASIEKKLGTSESTQSGPTAPKPTAWRGREGFKPAGVW